MRKVIRPGGAIEMVREEHDDLIATLEQENRQLHARNQRLEQELEKMQGDAVDSLRSKLNMTDDETKFQAFRLASKLVAKCFEGGDNRGVLVTEVGDKLSIMGLNADVSDVIDLANDLYAKLEQVVEHNGDDTRVLN